MSVKYIPLKSHFYIEKLGFAGVNLYFLFLIQNIDCGYSLELPRCLPTINVLNKSIKNSKVFFSNEINNFNS